MSVYGATSAVYVYYAYYPNIYATQSIVASAIETVEEKAFVLVDIVAMEVEVTRVTEIFEVVLAFEVLGPEEPLPEQPVRPEALVT